VLLSIHNQIKIDLSSHLCPCFVWTNECINQLKEERELHKCCTVAYCSKTRYSDKVNRNIDEKVTQNDWLHLSYPSSTFKRDFLWCWKQLKTWYCTWHNWCFLLTLGDRQTILKPHSKCITHKREQGNKILHELLTPTSQHENQSKQLEEQERSFSEPQMAYTPARPQCQKLLISIQ
jgi:hypothetical protein